MTLRTSIVAFAAMLAACASNPPAQEPTTTGATTSMNDGTSENGASSSTQTQNQNDHDVVPEQGMQQPSTNQNQNGMTDAFSTDAQIAAFTDAANKAEIQQGKLALKKAKDPQVRAYAQMIIDQHGQAERTQQRTLSTLNITPEVTAPTTSLESDAQSGTASLESKTGADFDKAYIDLQIKEHQQVIHTLDDKILPVVHDAQFKTELTNLRPELEHHLERAQALQQKLGTP